MAHAREDFADSRIFWFGSDLVGGDSDFTLAADYDFET